MVRNNATQSSISMSRIRKPNWAIINKVKRERLEPRYKQIERGVWVKIG